MRAEDRLGDEDADGPLDPWQMFARRQTVGGGSAILLALQEDTLPDLVPRFHSCPRVGPLGALPAANIGGRPANSSFSAPTL